MLFNVSNYFFPIYFNLFFFSQIANEVSTNPCVDPFVPYHYPASPAIFKSLNIFLCEQKKRDNLEKNVENHSRISFERIMQ